MNYEYLTNVPTADAVDIFIQKLKASGCTYKTETVKTTDSLYRITASAVYAKRCSPHYCASAMDGIAVLAQKSYGASEADPIQLNPQDFVQVDTGDALPEGTDAVIMIEDVIHGDNGSVLIQKAAVPWQHVRQIGEDISMGDMIAPSFTKMNPAMIGAFLAAGVLETEVIKKPVCGIIPTGDEIISADAQLQEGYIPEFNSAIFSAMFSEWGAESVIYPIVPDCESLLENAVRKAAAECDMVIVIAGSSAGRDDYTSAVLQKCGTMFVHGVAMKPGKPAILGSIGSVPFLGVPGYPVSGIIAMRKFAAPIIEMMTCSCIPEETGYEAIISRKLISGLKYEEYIRCRSAFVGDKLIAVPMHRGAGVISGYAKCSGLIEIPQNSEGYEAGQSVQLKSFCDDRTLHNSLLVVGSHDPIVDEVADIMRRCDVTSNLLSAHVGSMGAIMAALRKEMQLGGIHLLDETTGEYNKSYLRKYFPNGGVRLIRGVGRLQGLIVPKGNPRKIMNLSDIVENELSYVNRQKGSGTRILLDYLMAQQGIDRNLLYGYSREEYTHTAVAAIVASGSADVGLGIYSAASVYDLDFIPLWNENYDFIVTDEAFEMSVVQRFIDILHSNELADRLERMGGYAIDSIGETIDWR